MYAVEKKIADNYKMCIVKCRSCLSDELLKIDNRIVCKRCGKEYKEE